MNFAATLARGLFPGSEVEGRPASESANPANLGEAEGGSLEDQELTQEEESPVSAEKEMLPIGDAVPEGEHVRTLRVYSKSSSPSPTAPVSAKTCPDLSSTAAGVPDEERRAESGCREVQVLRVFREPDVMIAPNLITKEQCLHLLNLSEGKWTRSKTSIGMTSAPQVRMSVSLPIVILRLPLWAVLPRFQAKQWFICIPNLMKHVNICFANLTRWR